MLMLICIFSSNISPYNVVYSSLVVSNYYERSYIVLDWEVKIFWSK